MRVGHRALFGVGITSKTTRNSLLGREGTSVPLVACQSVVSRESLDTLTDKYLEKKLNFSLIK